MRPPVKIRVEGDERLKRFFGELREFGHDPTDLLDIWGALLENSTRSRFDTGTGPGGIPWPISERAKRDGGKTLVDKGNLEGSIRYEVRPGELEVGVDGVGASSKFAYVHQFGAVIRPVNAKALKFRVADGSFRIVQSVTIPARPIVGIDEDDKRDMREVAVEHLRELMNAGP